MERRPDATGDVESVFIEQDGTKHKCAGTMLPQMMTFKDAAGEEHRIFMDIGTHESAYQHFMDQNWEELKKFPKYVGQKHAKVDKATKAVGSEEMSKLDTEN